MLHDDSIGAWPSVMFMQLLVLGLGTVASAPNGSPSLVGDHSVGAPGADRT